MVTLLGRRTRPRVLRPPEATGPDPTKFWGEWSMSLGVLTFVSGLFLVLMFTSMGMGGSPYPWGPINDFLGALGNLMLAALLPVISRNAGRGPLARRLLWALSAMSVVGAASGFLLLLRALSFETSTVISMVVIVLQVAWMAWLNQRYAADDRVPRAIVRFGLAFAAAMVVGLVLVGGSFAFPWGSLGANLLLVPGATAGGLAWLAWPLWFILLGRWLRREAADSANPTNPRANGKKANQ